MVPKFDSCGDLLLLLLWLLTWPRTVAAICCSTYHYDKSCLQCQGRMYNVLVHRCLGVGSRCRNRLCASIGNRTPTRQRWTWVKEVANGFKSYVFFFFSTRLRTRKTVKKLPNRCRFASLLSFNFCVLIKSKTIICAIFWRQILLAFIASAEDERKIFRVEICVRLRPYHVMLQKVRLCSKKTSHLWLVGCGSRSPRPHPTLRPWRHHHHHAGLTSQCSLNSEYIS